MTGARPRSIAGTPPFGDDPRRACARKSPNLFCPPEEASRSLVKVLQGQAKAICGTCPRDIRTACLIFAVVTKQAGVWAGTDDQERAALRDRLAARIQARRADPMSTPTRVPAETIDQLDRGTLSTSEIARQLGVSRRTVLRRRSLRGTQAMDSTVDERGAA